MAEVLYRSPETGDFNLPKTVEFARGAEWQTYPALVISENDIFLPGVELITPPEVVTEAHRMADRIADDFAAVGSKVFVGNNHNLHGEDSARAQAIGIVFAGKLPEEVAENLENPYLDTDQIVKANQDVIPQLERFLDIAVVRQFRKLKIGSAETKDEASVGGFRTITMLEDPTGIVNDLSNQGYNGNFECDHRLEALARQIMARQGTMSTILRTWRRDEISGGITFDNPILCTLEGGHPQVESDEELSVRLMEIGSSRTLEIERDIHPEREEIQERAKNPLVRHLQNFMWFLGTKNAFAAPVKVEEMVKTDNPKYLEGLIGFTRWAGQAEGAGGVRVPNSQESLWSASGRFEAVKTDLHFEDIVGTTPWPENWRPRSDGAMALRVIELKASNSLIENGGFTHKFPSIESGPLTYGAAVLDQTVSDAVNEGLVKPLKFNETEEGYQFDENGEFELSAVTGWVHMHRSFKVDNPEKINVVPANIKKYPALPCGTEAERDMFADAMVRAWQGWEDGGRKAVASVFYMPNHGMLLMPHPTVDEDGFVPANPFELTRLAISNGDLELLDGVYQDNSAFAKQNYLSF